MSNQAWDKANLVWVKGCNCKDAQIAAYLGCPKGKDYLMHIPVCNTCNKEWGLKKKRKFK